MDMDKLVSEVTRQVLQGMQGGCKSPSRILALLCGVSEKVDAAINSLREISETLSSLGVELVQGGELSARVGGQFMAQPSQVNQPYHVPQSVGECIMPRGDCVGCGHCAVRKVPAVMALIDAGAARVGARPGILTPQEQVGAMIDHTLLKPEATETDVRKLCEEARKHVFASVCINPAHVELSARLLAGSPVKVCTVIGFPLGSTTTGTKAFETREAIMKGADEIDMVINVGALKVGNYKLVEDDIRAVKQAAGDKLVKVILETALLTDEEKVKACTLCKTAGADFVKTSTGFGPGGATVEDIRLMRKTVGFEMGVKASGGVRDYETAKAMVDAGATRIGASASVKIVSGQGGAGGGY